MRIYTIGHSTRTLQGLVEALKQYSIETLVDVRRYPRSRKNPQFNKEDLEVKLPQVGMSYVWMGESLGGWRKSKGTVSTLRHASGQAFRGYAEYMQTEEFQKGVAEFLKIAEQGKTAIMCAEIVYWRCHRRLIADELASRGIEVTHIVDENHSYEHQHASAKS